MVDSTYYFAIFATIFVLFYFAGKQYQLYVSRNLLQDRIRPYRSNKNSDKNISELNKNIFSKRKNDYNKWLNDGVTALKNRYNCYASIISFILLFLLYYHYNNLIIVYASVPAFIIINLLALKMYYKIKHKQIAQDLPESLNYIHRSLRAGSTLQQALIALPDNCPTSLKEVFQHIADKIRLGQEIDTAIWESTRHLKVKEFNYLVILSKIQQEVGGNFSETVNTLSEMLKSKNMQNMKLRALTAEAKSSSTVLGSLPFVIGIIISCINPDYINVFFYDTRGNYLLIASALLLTLGTTIMLKLAKIDP